MLAMHPTMAAALLAACLIGWCEGAKEAWCNISVETGRPADLVKGSIFFSQETEDADISVTVDLSGFNSIDSVTKHGFHVHTYPNMSNGCVAAGGHYNPLNVVHGGPDAAIRHVGDLGNVEEDNSGNVKTTFTDADITMDGQYSILDKAIVVHEKADDLGLGSAVDSNTTGAAGARLGCCVITVVAGSSFEVNGATPGVTPTALGWGLLLLLGASLFH